MRPPTFTIDARGNILLEVMQGYFSLDHGQMFREINGSFDATLEILREKKIDYVSLKYALILAQIEMKSPLSSTPGKSNRLVMA